MDSYTRNRNALSSLVYIWNTNEVHEKMPMKFSTVYMDFSMIYLSFYGVHLRPSVVRLSNGFLPC